MVKPNAPLAYPPYPPYGGCVDVGLPSYAYVCSYVCACATSHVRMFVCVHGVIATQCTMRTSVLVSHLKASRQLTNTRSVLAPFVHVGGRECELSNSATLSQKSRKACLYGPACAGVSAWGSRWGSWTVVETLHHGVFAPGPEALRRRRRRYRWRSMKVLTGFRPRYVSYC